MDKDADFQTILKHVCDKLLDFDDEVELRNLILERAKESEKEKNELRE